MLVHFSTTLHCFIPFFVVFAQVKKWIVTLLKYVTRRWDQVHHFFLGGMIMISYGTSNLHTQKHIFVCGPKNILGVTDHIAPPRLRDYYTHERSSNWGLTDCETKCYTCLPPNFVHTSPNWKFKRRSVLKFTAWGWRWRELQHEKWWANAKSKRETDWGWGRGEDLRVRLKLKRV